MTHRKRLRGKEEQKQGYGALEGGIPHLCRGGGDRKGEEAQKYIPLPIKLRPLHSIPVHQRI